MAPIPPTYEYFDPYRPSGDVIIAAANDARHGAQAVRDVAALLDANHRPAVESVDGELVEPVANAPTDVLRQVSDTERAVEHACGCVEYMGLAVIEHNIAGSSVRRPSVVQLNADYRAAAASDGGIDEDTLADLTGKYLLSRELLENKFDDAARWLDEGPTGQNVKWLWSEGALPFYAPLVFVDVDFTGIPTKEWVVNALEDFFQSHPDLQHDPHLGVLRSIVVEPVPPQEEIDESLNLLREAGLLEGEPNSHYLEWLTWTLRRGLDPEDIVERAEQEGVTMSTFDPLRELEWFEDPDSRRFFLLDGHEDAEDIARLTELMHGGTPSVTDDRRADNQFTYEGLRADGGVTQVILGPIGSAAVNATAVSDVQLLLDTGGAVVTTPEGTLMAAAGPEFEGFPSPLIDLPNPADLATRRGGTTYGEMYVLNGSHNHPEVRLRHEIEDDNGLPLMLLHERLHSEQWADEGYWQFLQGYLREHASGGADASDNDYEAEAILEWGDLD